MDLPTLAELEDAARVVYAAMPPTPQYAWPLLAARTGARAWLKALFRDTHNAAEGAGAAGLAALLEEREANRGLAVGLVLTGANADADRFAGVLRRAAPLASG